MNVIFGKSDSSAAAPKQIRFVHNQGQPPSKRRRINAAYVFFSFFFVLDDYAHNLDPESSLLTCNPTPADASHVDAAKRAAMASARHVRHAPKTATSAWATPRRRSATAPTPATSLPTTTSTKQWPFSLVLIRQPALSPGGPTRKRTVMPETATTLPSPTATRDLVNPRPSNIVPPPLMPRPLWPRLPPSPRSCPRASSPRHR